jgi:isopentenyl diphosphate isomerase/L-lactate dehydrogenase-like FMN-dependent dehydrogenase
MAAHLQPSPITPDSGGQPPISRADNTAGHYSWTSWSIYDSTDPRGGRACWRTTGFSRRGNRVSSFKYQLSSRSGPITVSDYRELARRAVPGMVWAYVEFGAEEMTTLAANRSAFSRYALRSRVLTGNEGKDLATTVAGQSLSLPVLLAPTGLAGLAHWTGERGAAQAAEHAGTRAILSTGSSYSFEEVAAATNVNHFFQLYPWADLNTGRHDLTLSLIQRAQKAGYHAMFVTVDVPVSGNRESERKWGMGRPPILTPGRILGGAIRPAWWTMFLRHRRFSMRNLVESTGAKAAVESLTTQYTMTRPELNWDDFAWMRDQWDGPMYIKGVLDPDDAARAVELGANGVVVSNHGGRQLDGAQATLDALPAIVARVGDRAEVLLDGGIRRGSDVVKALCLGATAVCIGRPYLYGLAANGAQGVEHVLEIFREEIARTMTLMGVASVKDLGPSSLLATSTPHRVA